MAGKGTAPALDSTVGKTAEQTPSVNGVLQAGFTPGKKLGPVQGRGKTAGPCPAELQTDLDASLASCNGVVGGEGGDAIIRYVTTGQKTTLGNDIKKWRRAKEQEGIFTTVPIHTTKGDKPSKDHQGEVRFAVFLTAPLPK